MRLDSSLHSLCMCLLCPPCATMHCTSCEFSCIALYEPADAACPSCIAGVPQRVGGGAGPAERAADVRPGQARDRPGRAAPQLLPGAAAAQGARRHAHLPLCARRARGAAPLAQPQVRASSGQSACYGENMQCNVRKEVPPTSRFSLPPAWIQIIFSCDPGWTQMGHLLSTSSIHLESSSAMVDSMSSIEELPYLPVLAVNAGRRARMHRAEIWALTQKTR